MKRIIPNLFVDECGESLEFYKRAFGGDVRNSVPSGDGSAKLMHAELHVNDQCVIFFGDRLDPAPPNANIHIFLAFDSEEEIRSAYDALRDGALTMVELGESAWGTLHAVVRDKNGIIWDLDR